MFSKFFVCLPEGNTDADRGWHGDPHQAGQRCRRVAVAVEEAVVVLPRVAMVEPLQVQQRRRRPGFFLVINQQETEYHGASMTDMS